MLLLLLVSQSRATLPEIVFNIYNIDLSHKELFESGKGAGRTEPECKKSSVGINRGNDSNIQRITPVFQRQYLLTRTEPESGISVRQLHRTQEATAIEESCWSNRLLNLLRSHNIYQLHHLPLLNRERFPPNGLSILNRDFDGNPCGYELSASASDESDIDPLLDALIHIQSRLGNPFQTRPTSSFSHVIDQAQHYMEIKSNYPNRMLNIDGRYQVYVLSGTPLSQPSEPNLRDDNFHDGRIRLLGFIVLRLDEYGAIDESFLMEVIFDRGNLDNLNRAPTPGLAFRQAIDICDDFDESVIPPFTNPASGNRNLHMSDREYVSDVQWFIDMETENGRVSRLRSERTSSSASRDTATSSSSSYGLRRLFFSFFNSFSRFDQSKPIDIPGRDVRNRHRSAEHPESLFHFSASSSESDSRRSGQGTEGTENASSGESIFFLERDEENYQPLNADNPAPNATEQHNPNQPAVPNNEEQRINVQLTIDPAFFSAKRPAE